MEALMSFGIQGPKGDTGPQGPRGATGPQGPAGAAASGYGLITVVRAWQSGDMPASLYNGKAMSYLIIHVQDPMGSGLIIHSTFPLSLPGFKITATKITQTNTGYGAYTFMIFG